MTRPAVRRLALLTALLGLAFVLRLYRLDSVPLRGDEAFAVRYWAAPPGDVLRDLAGEEPHPLGAFFAFWAWKSLAGESEFAMRYLPLLGNLVGTAAAAALARRLFAHGHVAYLVAGLWAIHPFLIWHSQDVRNYALWAGFSPLAMILFLRATARNRRRDWLLYVLAESVALYLFFLEAFLFAVQIVYLLASVRPRAVWRSAARAWGLLVVLLIPWLIQAAALSVSGYRGATAGANPAELITGFLPVLLTGREWVSPWHALIPLLWLGLVALLWAVRTDSTPHHRQLSLLTAWVVLPAILVLLFATRMRVFHPRYLVASVPALLLITGGAVFSGESSLTRRVLIPARLAVLVIPLLGLPSLVDYYQGENAKSPDWPALAAYLDARTHPGDLIIQTLADPAFGYYVRDDIEEMSLDPEQPASEIEDDLNRTGAFWLIGRRPDVEALLQDRFQPISFHTLSNFSIMQFRPWLPSEDEILVTTGVTFGDIARLRGYTVQGPDAGSRAITVLLYWQPLAQGEIDYVVFAHLVGPNNPATSSPLWDQEDHRPLYGFASTLSWEPGTLYRDPYHLLEDPALTLAPGEYSIQIGLYDPATEARLPVSDSSGQPLGDSFPLLTFPSPPPANK